MVHMLTLRVCWKCAARELCVCRASVNRAGGSPNVIRKGARDHSRMSEPKRKRLVRKRKLEKWSGRGEIYAWLRAHHKKIKSLKVGDDRPWSELLLDLRMDLAGIIPAERIALNNVLNTWKRVCRDLGDSPPVYRFKNYPSRIPKDWRPRLFRRRQWGRQRVANRHQRAPRSGPASFARPHPRIRSPAGN